MEYFVLLGVLSIVTGYVHAAIDVPANTKMLVGYQNNMLTCTYTPAPTFMIFWNFGKLAPDSTNNIYRITPAGDGSAIGDHLANRSEVIPPSSVNVTSVSAADDGHYGCRVIYTGGAPADEATTIVKVYSPPTPTSAPDCPDDIVSHSVECGLDIHSDLTVTYRWYIDGKIVPNNTGRSITLDKDLLETGTNTIVCEADLTEFPGSGPYYAAPISCFKSEPKPHSNTGAIVGGVVGGLAGVGLIASVSVLVYFRLCKKKPEKETQNATEEEKAR